MGNRSVWHLACAHVRELLICEAKQEVSRVSIEQGFTFLTGILT